MGRDQEHIKLFLEKKIAPIHGNNSSVKHLGFQCDELTKVAPVDYMVNSAGIARDSLLVAHASQDIGNMISTNLIGTILLNKAIAKGMMRRSIINISSVVGLQENIGQSVYSASNCLLTPIVMKTHVEDLGTFSPPTDNAYISMIIAYPATAEMKRPDPKHKGLKQITFVVEESNI
ncbi:reductase [Linnemannia gamsii]|uniref:Reductase n=1 Tax=Linnemannia gamsii TaxID=64522 RepID=A0ABQ7JN15_9FUNG|nr:reductase [Linnemannia gamsii]